MGGTTAYRGSLADPGAHVPGHGFVAGFDKAFGSNLTLGISGGQSSPEIELDRGSDRSKTRMLQFGGYGRYALNSGRIAINRSPRADLLAERHMRGGRRPRSSLFRILA
jgi:hypothetical protein